MNKLHPLSSRMVQGVIPDSYQPSRPAGQRHRGKPIRRNFPLTQEVQQTTRVSTPCPGPCLRPFGTHCKLSKLEQQCLPN
ncbi:hypothetical protein Y032_0021g281 [Ancylostoma ceylanicum]|uniref:Uncharacterized protein n=1 Tax=Ancylostoma ceylanicum TaxID=53326 RepID=A0A016UYV9_9BILA|nr:hypothetical protein Y032_0021g281 [Ancylostoma ceylanicum]